ncbi:MAG: tetratricopeptide repeat protein [Desulfuromonadaceae bacterium]|nr:tetratricopeptide repeat protein [Desulfuromonadaceae bacterium]
MISEKRQELAIGLAVAMVAFLAYANSLGNGFVWDDDLAILANPALKGTIGDVFRSIDTGRATELTPYYRPLTLLTYLIEQRLHGFTPFLVRLISVLLHAVNTFLVYRLGTSLKINRQAVVIAGLLFAVHPLHSEAVDFNASRNTLMAAFFILTTYLAHQRSVRGNTVAWAYFGASLLFAGLLSKETALFALLMVVFLEVEKFLHGSSVLRRTVVLRLIPYIICIAVYFVLRNRALSGVGVHLEIFSGLGARLLDNLYIIPRYLLTVVWPVSGSAKYFVPDDMNLLALPLAAAWLFIVGVCVWLLTRGRTPTTIFGLVWLIAFWLPVSGFFPIPSAPLADRFLYVPAIGLWLIIGDQFSSFFQPSRVAQRYAVAAVALVVLLLSVVTFRRNTVWNNDISLFTRLADQYPERAFAHHNLGCAYLDKVKNLYLAEQSFEKALALEPTFPRLHTQMGYVRLQRGDYGGALRHYDAALKINPFDAEARLNSGTVLERLQRYEEALFEYQRFLDTPGNDLPEARLTTPQKIAELTLRLKAAGNGGKPR